MSRAAFSFRTAIVEKEIQEIHPFQFARFHSQERLDQGTCWVRHLRSVKSVVNNRGRLDVGSSHHRQPPRSIRRRIQTYRKSRETNTSNIRLRQSGITRYSSSRHRFSFDPVCARHVLYILLISKCTRVALRRGPKENEANITHKRHIGARIYIYIYICVSMWSSSTGCYVGTDGGLVVRHNDQYIYDGSECVNRCRLLDQSGTRLFLSFSPPFTFLGSLSLSFLVLFFGRSLLGSV